MLLNLKEQTTLEFRQGEPPKQIPKPSHLLIKDNDKYVLDWKMLNKDLLFAAVDRKPKMMHSNFLTDPLTCIVSWMVKEE